MTPMLHDWITHHAERRPDARAVVDPDGVFTYSELELHSNRIAHLLRAEGCVAGDRVALLLPRSRMAVAAILATLKVGGIYVPIEPTDPTPRTARILRVSRPRVLLVDREPPAELLESLPGSREGDGPAIGYLGNGRLSALTSRFTLTDDVWSAPASAPPVWKGHPRAPAYLLFTSGSTGTPKGVLISHGNVATFVAWAVDYFGLGPSSRLSGHAPLTFDLSTFDLYATFAAGAELHPVPREANVLPHRLVEFMRERALSHWFSVPSALELVARFEVLPRDGLPALRTLAWCGEALPVPVLRYWMDRLPEVAFTNLYGPTETTVASTFYPVPRPLPDSVHAIPIGTSCPGEEVLVLDDLLRPTAPGETGHIHIRGSGVGLGYWRDERQTRAAFLADPFSDAPGSLLYRTGDLGYRDEEGSLHHLGREDRQIKTRGYRVELGEVETALNGLPEVARGAVVALETEGFDGKAIACAYMRSSDVKELPPRRLRKRLEQVLPTYMLPVRWKEVEELPRTPNGKVDRSGVERLFVERPGVDRVEAGSWS